MNPEETAVQAYYQRGEERDRLSHGAGQLEFIRTTEILARRLPPPPAVVADIGGGPGRYTLWLAELGYQVEHRDLMPLHVSQLRADAAGIAGISTAVGDARELDLPDAAASGVVDEAERTGVFPPLGPGSFTAYAHRPGELQAELTEAGLEATSLLGVEGPGVILPDLEARMADPADRAAVLDGARALENVPELAGLGPHLLATAVRPPV